MILRGKIVPGPMKGEGYIEHFYYRIVHTLGFEPYKGTLDIRLEQKFAVERYATKVIDHVLLDGRRMTDAYLCPVTLIKGHERHKAWILKKHGDIYSKGIVEVISKDRIKDAMGLKDGDEVELDLPDKRMKKGERRREMAFRFRRKKQDIRNIMSGDTTLMKR